MQNARNVGMIRMMQYHVFHAFSTHTNSVRYDGPDAWPRIASLTRSAVQQSSSWEDVNPHM
jgi:hypothetical protein